MPKTVGGRQNGTFVAISPAPGLASGGDPAEVERVKLEAFPGFS